MRAVVFRARGDVGLADVREPEPGPGEVKIRVRGCSLCGTDLKVRAHGHQDIKPPRVQGHEVAGEIASAGAGVTGWRTGDRVQVIAAIPCLRCEDCQLGRPTTCHDKETISYHYDGGFAEYMIVPAKVLAADGINAIPDGLGFAEASVTEPLACVLNGQDLIGLGAGDDVVVFGAGPVGCLHVRLARSRGAARVFLVELNQARLDRAASLVVPDAAICAGGTDPVERVLQLTGGRGADVVITAAASGQAQQQAVHCAARRGRISLFAGLPPGERGAALDTNLVHYRELTLTGAASSGPAHNSRALALIAAGEVRVGDLITHRLSLDRYDQAVRLVEQGEAIKVTIEP